jgi:hypothetical protein
MPIKPLLQIFGAKPAGKDLYCFADLEMHIYIKLETDEHTPEVDSLTISTFPNCLGVPAAQTSIDPALWRTPQGVGLGSTKEEVLRAYGRPVYLQAYPADVRMIVANRNDSLVKGKLDDSHYLYSCLLDEKHGCNDLRVTRFGFDHGKVNWIAISDSE